MKKTLLKLKGIKLLSRNDQKNIIGGKVAPNNSCVSSSTCTQGCMIIDNEGCYECSGCCIA